MLDHVHGRHREAGAVDDAADIAVQRDVIQAVLRRLCFARILLRVVAQLGDIRPPEHRVVIKAHLHVEGEHLAVLGDHERVDLDHGGVELPERLIRAQDGRRGLIHLRRGEAEAEPQLPGLERLHPDGRLDHLAQDGRGLPLRDLFDLHAPVRVRHHDNALALAVEHQPDVQLAVMTCRIRRGSG